MATAQLMGCKKADFPTKSTLNCCKPTPKTSNKVWKFDNFSISQILREINFEESKSAKSPIVTHLMALNFDLNPYLHFLNARTDQINKIKCPKNGKKRHF